MAHQLEGRLSLNHTALDSQLAEFRVVNIADKSVAVEGDAHAYN